jgi:Cu2+-exporting ATPase
MKCAGCVKAVETQLAKHSGVKSACVNLVTEVAVVEYETQIVRPEELAQKLTRTGFPSQLRKSDRTIEQTASDNRAKRQRQKQQRIQQLITAAILLIISSIGHLHHLGMPAIPVLSNIWLHWGLATLALLIPGRSLLIDGGRSLWQGMPNMNTLVGLGTVSAYLASCIALLFPQLGWECFFDEPVMLLGFIFLGRTLEKTARDRASVALEKLVSLQPTIARLTGKNLETAGEGIEIPVEQVKIGEWLRVLPGEKIPVDGIILQGEATIDESMLTGESLPVSKIPEDSVTGGTILQSGIIVFEVTSVGSNTTLAKIIQLVEDAQTRKAPIQKLADTIAGYFAYGVMTIASLTCLFWYFIGTHLWSEVLVTHSHGMVMTTSPLLLSLKLAIAVLVIACPCALGLATPTAILVGTGIGADRGILIKGGDILETVHQLNRIVFDKTGTLTEGKPVVTACLPLNNISDDELLQLAASLENGSNHPLATAIVTHARQRELFLLTTEAIDNHLGRGIQGLVAGESICLGNRQWLSEVGVSIDPNIEAKYSKAIADKTVVYVGKDRELIGLIVLEDKLRPDALTTVSQLQKMGLEVILLTGDRYCVARSIAQRLKIDRVFAEIKPDAKAEIIASLQNNSQTGINYKVAMVGDGINDAPALAKADIGISLQGSTDIAIETADIVLMENRLSDVVEAIKLSRITAKTIEQNLSLALAYNCLAIPVAAGILLPNLGIVVSPVVAAIAMASSSLIVVSNSLLLNFKFSKIHL